MKKRGRRETGSGGKRRKREAKEGSAPVVCKARGKKQEEKGWGEEEKRENKGNNERSK